MTNNVKRVSNEHTCIFYLYLIFLPTWSGLRSILSFVLSDTLKVHDYLQLDPGVAAGFWVGRGAKDFDAREARDFFSAHPKSGPPKLAN